jgi:hypothetical protein
MSLDPLFCREKTHGPFPERGPDEGYLIGARNVEPVNGGGDWTCTWPDHWVFNGTGMKRGDRIPGLIGWEYHGDPPQDLPGLLVIAEGTAWVGGTKPQHWAATIYPGPKGNLVFNASTIFWSQGLSAPPGTHAALVALEPAARPRRARATDHPERAETGAGWRLIVPGESPKKQILEFVMRIAIAGATGFLGRYLVRHLALTSTYP